MKSTILSPTKKVCLSGFCLMLFGLISSNTVSAQNPVPYLAENPLTGNAAPPVLSNDQGVNLDVNGDGAVTVEDALAIIEWLNENGLGLPPPLGSGFDVNGDKQVTLSDVLEIVDALNERSMP